MKKCIIVFIGIFFFCGINVSYGLDWKKLHEASDKITLSDALATVKAKPDSMDDLYLLGLVYLNAHKDKEAGETFNKVLTLDSNLIEAKWGVAEMLRRQHQTKKSEELLNEVLKSNPDFPAAYLTLAYIRYDQTNFNEAVRLVNKVLGKGEKNVDRGNYVRARLLYGGAKGMIAYNGGLLAKVINGTAVLGSIRAAEKRQPDAAGVQFGLGSFYLLAPSFAGGNLKKAEEYLKKTIQIDPLFADAYVRLGQLYKIKGDSVKYNEYLNKTLKIDPQNELALDIKNGKCKFICL